eukprot:m.37907 g.37907  ORF g.37907 m.37907 type:complete len:93 (-) comp9369_c0_seq1:75-353(-)
MSVLYYSLEFGLLFVHLLPFGWRSYTGRTDSNQPSLYDMCCRSQKSTNLSFVYHSIKLYTTAASFQYVSCINCDTTTKFKLQLTKCQFDKRQ